MRWQLVWSILRKELRETFRDRRTLMMMVGLPILLYPMLIIGMSKLQDSQEAASEARSSVVGVWGNAPEDLMTHLREKKFTIRLSEGLSEDVRRQLNEGLLTPLPADQQARPRKGEKRPDRLPAIAEAAQPIILSRKVDTVLVVWPDLEPSIGQGSLGHAAVLYDSVRPDSEKAGDRLSEAMAEYRRQLIERRERERGLQPGFSRAMEVARANVAPPARRAGFGLGQLLPFLLIMASITGAFYIAIETTAGEKERGTMQTLLCAPLSTLEIITGKFLAVWTVSLISAAANVASMAFTFARLAGQAGGSIAIAPSHYATAMLMLLPVTFMVTAIFLAAGSFANDFKDGQNYLTPIMFAIMFPASAGLLPGLELDPWTAFVPILNITLLMKAIFIGEARPDAIFLTLISSLVYASLSLLLAARIFAREQVLLGGKESWKALLGLERPQRSESGPATSMLIFSIALVAAFYGSLALHDKSVPLMLLVMQYGFFLAPVLFLTWWQRLPWRDTLSLRAPSPRALIASILIGCSAWAVAGGISTWLLPPPESLAKAMQKFLLLDQAHPSLILIWFCVAITPAICEELLFRGLILNGFRTLGPAVAIGLTALLFGLAHSSIYRLLPTFLLGLVFGYAVSKSRSIFTSSVMHLLNNGLLATISFQPSLAARLGFSESQMPVAWVAGSAVIMGIGLWLLSREQTAPENRHLNTVSPRVANA